jgi:lauroyl/myristoyl acyltransferase
MPPDEIEEQGLERGDGWAAGDLERRGARLLKRMARRHPRLALRLLAVLGRARADRFGRRRAPTPSEVAERLGISDARAIERIRREVVSNELRNHVLRSLVRARGLGAAVERVRVSGAEHVLAPHRAGDPVIAVGWHAGGHRGVPSALLALGLPVAMPIRDPDVPLAPALPMRWLRTDGREAGAVFLRRALAELAAGRVVAMLVDGTVDARQHPAPFLGVSHSVQNGVAVLARLSRARVVPVTTRWAGTSSRVLAEIHPALPEPRADRGDAVRFDAELVASVAAFFERWVRAHPGTLHRLWYRSSNWPKPAAGASGPTVAPRPGQPSP